MFVCFKFSIMRNECYNKCKRCFVKPTYYINNVSSLNKKNQAALARESTHRIREGCHVRKTQTCFSRL